MTYIDLDTKSCISTVTSGTGTGTECNDPLNIGCTYNIPNSYTLIAVGTLLGIIYLKTK